MVYGRGNGDNRLGFFLDEAGAERLRYTTRSLSMWKNLCQDP